MLRALAVLVIALWVAPASAQTDLSGHEAALASSDPAAREAAITALRTLPPSMHDAIVERIGSLVRRAPPPPRLDELFTAFRRATGSRRADDVVDVADGVAGVLSSDRSDEARRIGELLLLTRSLEGHGTSDALRAAVESLRLPGAGAEMEGRRLTLRLEGRVAGTVLRSLGHGDVHVREWARWSVHRLGLDAPGTFVRSAPPPVLADVLLAYGEARLMSAMPVVASFVDAPQRIVREAAFAGLAAYGRNAIWTIRDAYRLHADEDADMRWGAERTLEALRDAIERERLAAATEALEGAQAALTAGDAEGAARLADEVLLTRPELGTIEIARIYLSAGEAALGRGEPARAVRHLARAERLALTSGETTLARRAAGLATFVTAETELAAGTLDVDAYARAAAAVPDDARLAEIAGSYGEVPAAADRTLPLALAALLFLFGALLLVRPAAPPPTPPAPPTPVPGEGESEGESEAAITSPG